MRGFARGKNPHQKNIFGRSNVNYTGPSRALPPEHALYADAMSIAQEFANTTDAAAKALDEGDVDTFTLESRMAAGLYSAHQEFSRLVSMIPQREDQQRQWTRAYREFRKRAGLADHDPDAVMEVPINEYQVQVSQDAVRDAMAERAAATGRDPRTAYKEAFGRAVQKNRARRSKQNPNYTNSEREDGEPEAPAGQGALPPGPTASGGASGGGSGSGGGGSTPPPPPPPPPGDDGGDKGDSGDGKKPDDDGNSGDKSDALPPPSKRQGRKPQPDANLNSRNVFDRIEESTGLDKFGAFRVTFRPRVGPFVFNFGRSGLASISLDSGRIRYRVWSREYAAGLSSIDLPSGMSFRGKSVSKGAHDDHHSVGGRDPRSGVTGRGSGFSQAASFFASRFASRGSRR